MYFGNGGFDWTSLELMTLPELQRAVAFVIDAKQTEAENAKKAQAQAQAKAKSSKVHR